MITEEQFCELYSTYFSDPVTQIAQLPKQQYGGAELFKFVRFATDKVINTPAKLYKKGQILSAIKLVFEIEDPTIRSREPVYVAARKIYSWFLDKHTEMTLVAIARVLNLWSDDKPDHTGIIYYRNWVRNNKPMVQHHIDAIYKILENDKTATYS